MSAEAFSRFRSRFKPSPWGQQLTGRLYCETIYDSGIYVKFQDRFDGSAYPYLRAEHCADQLHQGPPYRSGGPFRKISIDFAYPNGSVGNGTYYTDRNDYIIGNLRGRIKYVGGFWPPSEFWWPHTEDVINFGTSPSSTFGISSPLVPSTGTLDSLVWDKTKPKLEQGGLAVAVAELRDVPEMLHSSAKLFSDAWKRHVATFGVPARMTKFSSPFMAPKKVADAFLNHNFGWVPFINDLSSFLGNIENADAKIKKLVSENGGWHKRKAVLVNDVTVQTIGSTETSQGTYILQPAGEYIAGMMLSGSPRYEIVEQKVNFAYGVGSFRYYVDYLNAKYDTSVIQQARRMLLLQGARMTPTNVYKAIPWTWLVDWVSDVGRTIQSVQDQWLDDVAAKYLYLVHHQTKRQILRQFIPFNSLSGGPKTLSFVRVIDVKQRKEAESPFGFGLTWENLTPKQLAILAALGITRVK